MNKINEILKVEEERVITENERVVAEKARVASEQSRAVAEQAREAAEQAREAAESERKTNLEAQFAQISKKIEQINTLQSDIAENENNREIAEDQRSLAESERVAAELERKGLFDKYGKASGVTIEDIDSHYKSETVEDALGEIATSLDTMKVSINNAQSSANESKQSANEAKQAVTDALGFNGVLTVQASSWSDDLTAAVTISGVSENDMISVFPSSLTDKNTAEDAELFAYPQTNGDAILFSVTRKPSDDIVFYYFVSRGKEA
jgi:methyl-accepting chemotaxis protein